MGKLTHMEIARINEPGMYGDGESLWLVATETKTKGLVKRFAFRFTLNGKFEEIPVGAWPDTSLKDARARASDFRRAIDKGENPAAERKAAKAEARAKAKAAPAITFRRITLDYIEQVGEKRWRSLGEARDFLRSFQRYIFPLIGDLPVEAVGDKEALAVLDPLFHQMPNLARRTAARAETVFARARARGLTNRPNPFSWRERLKFIYAGPPPDIHYATIPWKEMPELYAQLVERGDDPAACAVRFMLSLALRPGEAHGAKFEMIDEANSTFTLPTTKSNRPFAVPLNESALAVVARARELRQNDYLFPGRISGKPVHKDSLTQLVSKLTEGKGTAHGCSRSGFSDWCFENNAAAESVIEASLNHVFGSTTTRAYKRGDQLELRRKLMAAYSDFLTGKSNVIAFPKAPAASG